MIAFYMNLFTTSNPVIPEDMDNLIEPLITQDDNEILTRVPDLEEIYATLWRMSSDKALAPTE